MTILDNYGRPLASKTTEVKASAAGSIISEFQVGQAQWTDHDFQALTKEAYVLNAVSYRCAKLIATCAASIPWLLYDRAGEIMENHALLDLLARPNPTMGTSFFFEAAYTYHLLAGHSYIEGVGAGAQPYRELWNHRPDRIKVVPGPYGIPQAYMYDVGGRTRTWPVDPRTGQGDMVQIKSFNPTNDWYGFSRVIPGAYGVDRHNAASKHNKSILDNGARPSGALIFEPIQMGSGHGAVSAPDEVLKQAEKELKERHSGAVNAGKPMVFGGNVRWEQFGMSLKDMDFDENKQDAARDICNAWGVPHVLVVKGQMTYNNMEEAKLQLYEETVIPLVQLFRTELNNWLTPKFGDGMKLKEDLDAVPALEIRREKKRESITTLLDKGVLSADEARDELDYGPRDENDVQTFEPQAIKALLEVSNAVGADPLVRYMKSVGLVPRDATVESVLQSALDLIEDDDDDDDDSNDGEQEEDGNEDEA